MSIGWFNACRKHAKVMKKEIESKGKHNVGFTPDADKRCKCDYPECKNKAYYEVLPISKKSLEELKEGKLKEFKG